jgi:heptosyltransferase I
MKVLIVKTSSLGDIAHAVPIVTYLHGARPDVEVDWLLEKPFAPLLEGQAYIRNIHRIDTKFWRQPSNFSFAVAGICNTLRLLRSARYDVVLDLQGNSKSGLFTISSGAPLRYGYDWESVREWPNLLATNRRVSLSHGDQHITDRALKVAASAFPAAAMGLSLKTLKADNLAMAAVKQKLERYQLLSKKLILIHPGTTWKTKCISAQFWTQFAAALSKNDNLQLLFTWGNEEELRVAGDIVRSIAARATIWPRQSLKELMALISQVDLVVGGDTGPVHIAAALGTSTLSFFRATDRWRNGPRGENHITFQSPMECSPCLLKDCPRDDHCSSMNIEVHKAQEAVYHLLDKLQ